MSIAIEKIPFGAGLLGRAEEWEHLLNRSSRPSIYSTFDYVYTSCLHFSRNSELFFLFFREKETGRLLAIFPVSIWRDTVHGVVIRRIEHGVTASTSEIDKPYPIIDQSCEAECWRRFSEYFRRDFLRWDVMAYNELWMDSGLKQCLRKLFPAPAYWTKTRPGPDSPIFALDGGEEPFWDSHRHIRSKDRRLERQLGSRLSFFITNDPQDVERCLDAYVETDRSSEKSARGIMRPEKERFYRELLPKLAAKGQVYFAMMYDKDAVVAAHVSYVFGNRVYFALCTYNPEYRKYSPGLVMHSRFIRFFSGKGLVEGDFLAGYAIYMIPWASRIEHSVNVQIRKIGWKNAYVMAWSLAGRIRGKHTTLNSTGGAACKGVSHGSGYEYQHFT